MGSGGTPGSSGTAATGSLRADQGDTTSRPESGSDAPGCPRCPSDLPEYWRDTFEEKAAIYEYEGRLSREDAEGGAWRDVLEEIEANTV